MNADFDKNGFISFYEAHHYALMSLDTIDEPIKTSGEFLRKIVSYDMLNSEDLKINRTLSLRQIKKYADLSQKAAIEGLIKKLDLDDDLKPFDLEQLYFTLKEKADSIDSTYGELHDSYKQVKADLWSFIHNNPDYIALYDEYSPQYVLFCTDKDKCNKLLKEINKMDDFQLLKDLYNQKRGLINKYMAAEKKLAKYSRLLELLDDVILMQYFELYAEDSQKEKLAKILACENDGL
ncbi:MAG: hypothetical protein ABIA04_16480 [Pseudomonadota bacterium]